MADDDHNPASDIDGQSGGSGFAKFGDSDRQEEQRAKRKGLVGKTVAGVVVLAAVAAVAAFTGGHAKKAPGQADPGVPVAGKVTTPIPPQVVFTSPTTGYAFYSACAKQPDGDGCTAALFRTVDGAVHWTSLPLPSGAPVDPTAWTTLQARSTDLLLGWQTGLALSTDSGEHWKRVTIDGTGSRSQVPESDFLVTMGSQLGVVDPLRLTAIGFRPPQTVEQPGGAGGQLNDGTLWMADSANYGMSFDGGEHWNVTPFAGDTDTTAPMLGNGHQLARLTGLPADETSGFPGDGGSLKASHVLFSTNRGVTWAVSGALTGPADNAQCTVFLNDGSLLGVAADGSRLLTLPKDASAFAPVAAGPRLPSPLPSCLASSGSTIWGATLHDRLLLSVDDGNTWSVHQLPQATVRTSYATPSPTPSAVH